MASLRHCYTYLQDAVCCCRSEGDLDDQSDEKQSSDGPHTAEKREPRVLNEKGDTYAQQLNSISTLYELPAPMIPPNSISASLPRSILLSTPESVARRTSRQTSLRFAPDPDDSMVSDTPSDFSRLAGKGQSQENVLKRNGTPRRTLGEMSIAKLTSGVADGKQSSR